MRLDGHGVSVDLPAAWEARISARSGGVLVHLATFPLHRGDGDFGAAATGRMRRGDAFVALVEYSDPKLIRPGEGLYAAPRPPAPALTDFAAHTLQVTRAGQLGWQRFFTTAGRTCCVYAVIMPGAERPGVLVSRLAAVLRTLTIAAPESSSAAPLA